MIFVIQQLVLVLQVSKSSFKSGSTKMIEKAKIAENASLKRNVEYHDEEDEEDLELEKQMKLMKRQKVEVVKGLYLESVDRGMLDFDFEKVCSVSLNNLNIYGCLTCGKYFQGIFGES